MRSFTGKTEDGFKYRTPKLRLRKVKRVPAPGFNLKIPEGLDPETFCRQIGGDCDDHADKFESIDEIFTLESVSSYREYNANKACACLVLNGRERSAVVAAQVHSEVPRTAEEWSAHF